MPAAPAPSLGAEREPARRPTLGTAVMALLISSPLERLGRLAQAYPQFVDLVTHLLEVRGHGNRPVFMPADEFLRLKDEVYTACSALLEA